jgi:hypothetical protein
MTSLKPEEDYLDEDKPLKYMVKKQNYCIISMLTPKSFPEEKRAEFSDQKILGVKVRGVFENYEDAKTNADKLQKLDKYHNIFVGEVGKWLPFDVDISEMETEDDPVYREQALNKYMKSYKDSLHEEEVAEKERKEEKLKGANVINDKSEIPVETGIGTTDTLHEALQNKVNLDSQKSNKEGTSSEEQQQKINEYKETEDDEIKNTEESNAKIEKELEDSKTKLKVLENKLSTIDSIYNELKK